MAKKIITVDDSASVRLMVGTTLREAGYEVLEAEDGAEAIKVLAGEPVDLVLTDLSMPNMDGLEFLKKLRSHPVYKHTPIILLTTESQRESMEKGKEAGATGWIVKPFQADQLVGVVRKVLG